MAFIQKMQKIFISPQIFHLCLCFFQICSIIILEKPIGKGSVLLSNTAKNDRMLLHREFRLLLESTQISVSHGFVQHGNTSCLVHSLAVAWYSLRLARFLHLSVSETELLRGALLHDYFLYDWHLPHGAKFHGFRHPFIALRNAQQCCNLSPKEENIIQRHMFPLVPLPPLCREAILVCIIDKACGLFETFRGEYRRFRWVSAVIAEV